MMRVIFFIVVISVPAIGQPLSEAEKKLAEKKSRREENFYFLQQTLTYSPISFVSPPFCDLGSPKNGYLLSADIVPQFVIGGDWMATPIHLSPRYKVRIFKNNEVAGDSSGPVRTPSFMPGGTVHFKITKEMTDSNPRLKYWSFTFFHHSNGQDNPEFKSGKPNFYNGNFSTNYFEAAYHWRRRRLIYDLYSFNPEKQNAFKPTDYLDYYGRIGYEMHVGTADSLKSSYGDHRINLTLGLIDVVERKDNHENTSFHRERNRLVLNITAIMDTRDRGLENIKRRYNWDLNYYRKLPSSPNTALVFTVGYYGSDTYNIYYLQKPYYYVRAGLAFGFFVSPVSRGDKKIVAPAPPSIPRKSRATK